MVARAKTTEKIDNAREVAIFDSATAVWRVGLASGTHFGRR